MNAAPIVLAGIGALAVLISVLVMIVHPIVRELRGIRLVLENVLDVDAATRGATEDLLELALTEAGYRPANTTEV